VGEVHFRNTCFSRSQSACFEIIW